MGERVEAGGFAEGVAELAPQRENACELGAGIVVVALLDIDPGERVPGFGFPSAVAELAELRAGAPKRLARLLVLTEHGLVTTNQP